MKRPLVSIVIPVYNGANYVGQAIESALAQTYRNIEVLVVNDGSTDGGATRAVVEGFGSSIRYIEKANGGVATALNKGIETMRGELFSWLSHDDLYKPDKVERQVEVYRGFAGSCVVIGDFELMDAAGITYHTVSIAGRNLVGRPLDAVFCGLINGCALLVPRELFHRAGLFEPGLPSTQDYDLWYRIARLAPFVHCPHVGVRQRIHAQQGSQLASHLDEAGRMFAHLVDSTPFEIMRAYDGSEPRFLGRVYGILSGSYPGLARYLEFRMDWLLSEFAYSVAVLPGPEQAATEQVVRAWSRPPVDIWIVPRDGCSAEPLLETAHTRCFGEAVLFLQPGRPLPEPARLAAIRQIGCGADLARPNPPGAHSLDNVIIRRALLPRLASAFANGGPDWENLASSFVLGSFPTGEPEGLLRKLSPERLREKSYIELGGAVAKHVRGALTAAGKAVLRDRLRDTLAGKSHANFRAGLERAVTETLRAMSRPDLPTILFVTHALGGGSHRHLNELTRALNGRANSIVACGEPGSITLLHGAAQSEAGLVFRTPDQLAALASVLEGVGIDRADVHHAAGFEGDIEHLLELLHVGIDATLVDYHLVATSPHLCFGDGVFVGDDRLTDPTCGLLRREPAGLLRKAERVFAISRDMAARVNTLFPEVQAIASRHWREASATRVRHVFPPRVWSGEPLRVVAAGWIVENKGRNTIIKAARHAKAGNLPVRFHILGEMDLNEQDRADLATVLTVHGRFPSEHFSEMLGGIAPHVAWLPAQVPETWSYVLTDYFEAALPVAASAIGAIAERCHGRPFTWLLAPSSPAKLWVDLFLSLHASDLRVSPKWAPVDHLPTADEVYFDPYLRPARREFADRLAAHNAGSSTFISQSNYGQVR